MTLGEIKKISKSMSYVLQHRPDTIGITLGEGGWVGVDILLSAFAQNGQFFSRQCLETVVADSDKLRFEFSRDRQIIRARQGHSVEVDLGYEPAIPPDVLYHGTATHFLDSICEQGLIKGKRHHVHMSTDKATMLAVARRHGRPALLEIDARAMHARGAVFHVTGNSVWLTDRVPPDYLRLVE
ncbi:MAG: RNA 2'-phosphotransferase [Planctomycetota bacterium]